MWQNIKVGPVRAHYRSNSKTGQKGIGIMRKTALLMGLGCSSLFAGVLWFLYARKEEHADLVKRFMASKRNLRQCAETINSTNQNRPAEIVYAADRSFVEALDEALRYMDTAPKHMLKLTRAYIEKLPNGTLFGFANCMDDVLRVANDYMEEVLILQQKSLEAHERDT